MGIMDAIKKGRKEQPHQHKQQKPPQYAKIVRSFFSGKNKEFEDNVASYCIQNDIGKAVCHVTLVNDVRKLYNEFLTLKSELKALKEEVKK